MKLKVPADSVLRQWGFEIFCIVMAIGVLVAMAVVMSVFDSQPVFDGPLVTLNAIISTLSTASRVSLLAMFASTISQWNWLLFSGKNRRLLDFEHLAEASRGPLGSLKVLLNSHIAEGWIVRFGALLTILTIALDPFAQQLVQLKEDPRPFEPNESRLASINMAKSYSRSGPGAQFTSTGNVTVDGDELSGDNRARPVPDYGMEVAVLTSFVDDESGVDLSPGFSCTQGSCRFKPYESLAVCSRCDDVSSSIKNRSREVPSLPFEFGTSDASNGAFDSTEYYLPNGLYLSNPIQEDDDNFTSNLMASEVLMTMFGTGDRNKTVNMQDIDTLIWAQSFIMVGREPGEFYSTSSVGTGVAAYECELHYCVKEFSASVEGGRLEETSKELEKFKRDPDSWKLDYESEQERVGFPDLPAWTEDYLAFHPVLSTFYRTPLAMGTPPLYNDSHYVDSNAVYGNSILMKNLFTACIEKNDNCTEENRDESFGPPNGFFAGNWTSNHKPDFAKKLWGSTDLHKTFERISESMTIAMRNGADVLWWSETGDIDDPDGIWAPSAMNGTIILPVPIYEASWPWIALHCTVTSGGLVFLVLTIMFTAKTGLPAWKSSELAIFAQAGGMEKIFDGDEKQEALEKKAREASVILLGRQKDVTSEESEESAFAAEGGYGRVSTASRARSEESVRLAEGTRDDTQ